jgi:hypothetical protein
MKHTEKWKEIEKGKDELQRHRLHRKHGEDVTMN